MAYSKILFCFMIGFVGFLPAITMATQYLVGDDRGWTLDFDYQTWAKNKTFKVGDTLAPPPSEGLTSGYDVITLTKPGKKWYICGVPTHCSDYNQKLVITVEDGAPAPAPASPAPQTEYWVGDDKGWTIDVDYQAWAKGKTFKVGDTLVFKYTKGHHNVFKVNQTGFQNCIAPPPSEGLTSGHDVITLAAPGKKWYICGFPTHCSEHKQKLAITVEGAPAQTPPVWAPAPAPGTPKKIDTGNSYKITSPYKMFVGGAVSIWTILTLV
uniref:Blue copper protein n=1 Tax=Petunia hybrida TaxID=4102 RepID=BCP_PETHY|nr:RecName: Full=Blue copper protein; Short=PhBcp; Flags: Precursor [Petunia x hybrida]ALC79558.1 blue copper protein [Petunia axillaris]